MHVSSLSFGTHRVLTFLDEINNESFNFGGQPPPLVWIELFLLKQPHSMVIFETMSPFQRREGIEILKSIRPAWQLNIQEFILTYDLDYKTLLESFSSDECKTIALSINYWDTTLLIVLMKRTSGFLCSQIASHIWFGDYQRPFSHFLFALFSHVEGTKSFNYLQSHISVETVPRVLPAVKEDVDVLLKWILSSSKSSPARLTIKSLQLICSGLNDNQRRRLFLRSVKHYPETFLYVLTTLTETEAKLVCRNNFSTMSEFVVKDEAQCRALIPLSRGDALRTILSKGRFLVSPYFQTFEEIMGVLKNVASYEEEDFYYITCIPPFIFYFFEFWNRFRQDIKLVINELDEHQLKALSLGINQGNYKRLLPEIENVMSPPHFAKFLGLFQIKTIEDYISAKYETLTRTLINAEESLYFDNAESTFKLNLELIQHYNSPLTFAILKLCDQTIPGITETYKKRVEEFFAAFKIRYKKPTSPDAERTLSLTLLTENDRKIGLLDDEDIAMLRIRPEADEILIEEYRRQLKLADSWRILNQKRIYALKTLETSIESREECFNLYTLVEKLL